MSGINTPQGELIVGDVIHGVARNCTVVPYGAGDADWYMVQFMTRQQLEEYALKNRLIIKESEE